MYFNIGGSMKADRYNYYPESFDRTKSKSSLFINLNHEFASTASVRAFEAYVSWIANPADEGCMHWMVS